MKCDVVVIECGLGGRLDPTNVIASPLLSVITNIGLDHIEILGDTVEKIAIEKAGIIKKDRPVVLYDIKNGYKEIEDVAKNKNANLYKADFTKIEILSYNNLQKTVFNYKKYKNIELNLLGMHQVHNATVVLESIEVLKKLGYNISNDNIYDGIKNVENLARLQILEKNPLVVMDGGHNVQCIEALIDELPKDKKIVFVIAIFREKDAKVMIDRLCKISNDFVVTYVNNQRCLKRDEILKLFNENVCVTYEKYIQNAIDIGKSIAGKEGVVCITGSLYLCGEILKCKYLPR